MHTSLDDLDRLAFLLARTVRQHHPAWLTQGFTLGDLDARLVPFPVARQELADGSAEAFERLVLRLVAGERGYILTDPEVRDAARRALEDPSPTLARVRPWAATRVVLARPSAGLGVERAPGDGTAPSAPSGAPPGGPPGAPLAPTPRAGAGGPTPGPGLAPGWPSGRTAAVPPAPPRDLPPPPPPSVPAPEPTAPAGVCVHCGCARPAHRSVTFCPYCGTDLRRQQCPACSTELEPDWRFCVTCGRGAEAPDPSLPGPPPA